jgi:methyl-accepting chemotaxis protein
MEARYQYSKFLCNEAFGLKELECGFMSAPRLPIESKLLLVSVAIVAGIVIFLIFFYNSYSQSLESERQYMTKNLSSSALGVVRHFNNLTITGELTIDEAQLLAMNTLKASTYGKNGYFWINDSKGKMIMHPYRPEIVGKVLMDMQDINGKYFFKEFIDISKKGGGWVTYYWPKPNTLKDYPKISYVTYFEPWDWILGTGDYIDDIQENITRTFTQASGLLFVMFLILIMGTIILSGHYVKQLGNLAIRDPLTNLYTKRLLIEILPQILEKSRRLKEQILSITFFDIDNFKHVNDTWGHSLGDEVLRQVASVLIQNSRADDYCIRYGGEEFIVIGFHHDKTSSVKVAERIRREVAVQVFSGNTYKFCVTLSAGIAFFDKNSETFGDALKRADEKLYASKQNGRDRVTI